MITEVSAWTPRERVAIIHSLTFSLIVAEKANVKLEKEYLTALLQVVIDVAALPPETLDENSFYRDKANDILRSFNQLQMLGVK